MMTCMPHSMKMQKPMTVVAIFLTNWNNIWGCLLISNPVKMGKKVLLLCISYESSLKKSRNFSTELPIYSNLAEKKLRTMTISNILAKRNNGTDIISTCAPSSLLKYKKRNNLHNKHNEDKSKCLYLPDFKKDRCIQ